MCVKYIGGCSVHRGDTMSTSGGYHECIGGVQYIGGIPWVHRGDIMSTSGDIGMFSTSGGYHDTCGDTRSTSGDVQYIGGYHECIGIYHKYIGGISWVHQGMFSTSKFSIEIERILSICSPTCIMISLRCTEHPRCTHGILPHSSWYPSDVLNIPRCTHNIPQCTHDIPRCTEHPPPPDVLNTPPPPPPDVPNIPRCTEHTLYRVSIPASTVNYALLKLNCFTTAFTAGIHVWWYLGLSYHKIRFPV